MECLVFADPLFVKICGLRDATSARVAIEAGADGLGFILAEARRQVTPEEIRTIRNELESSFDDLPAMIGVVVNVRPDELASICAESGLDMIQLSGDESPDILTETNVPVVKALRFSAGLSTDEALREVSAWLDGPSRAQHVIVEGHSDGSYGGTGTRADWMLVAELARRYPVILAGGLNPDNVGDAMAAVRAKGVDVSSGIETEGKKDAGKIRDFVARARIIRQNALHSR